MPKTAPLAPVYQGMSIGSSSRYNDPGEGNARIVNTMADWDDFVAFCTAIRERDWNTTFAMRQDGLLIELPVGPSAVVLAYAAPEGLTTRCPMPYGSGS